MNKEIFKRLEFIEQQGVLAGGKLLEVGCATGDFLRHAKETYEVWGNDISSFAVDEAKKKNEDISDRITSGLIEAQNYPKESFDVIVMWDVIEHLYDPVDAFKNLLDALKPGGVFVPVDA